MHINPKNESKTFKITDANITLIIMLMLDLSVFSNVIIWIKLGDLCVGCINGFNMDVWYIFPNLMDYEKSHL